MTLLAIALLALLASGLTLFSGFGLGTLLMPAFALLFPVEVAIAATAVVHLANNLFKLGLLGRSAVWRVALRFGIPAAASAVMGAWLLLALSRLPVITEYRLGGRTHEITVLGLVVCVLILAFAALELAPGFERRLAVSPRHLALGGTLSGFFGGLSGHQGAFRSAFLLHAGLQAESFVATGIACAVMVDVARLATYGAGFFVRHFAVLNEAGGWQPVAVATLAAFLGAWIGRRLLGKVTMRGVRRVVAVMLVVVGLAIGSGLA